MPTLNINCSAFFGKIHGVGSRFLSRIPATNFNRTIFYALALFTALLEFIFSTTLLFLGVSLLINIIASSLALITWIWMAVLISYNRRPQSTHPLCRSSAHFKSFAVFGVAWLVIFIVLASLTSWECNDYTPSRWCALGRFKTAVAFFMSLFSIIAAYLVYVSATASGAGLEGNVDQELDAKEPGEF